MKEIQGISLEKCKRKKATKETNLHSNILEDLIESGEISEAGQMKISLDRIQKQEQQEDSNEEENMFHKL